ncbi:MAG: c-type cytochrome [Sandaracinus sp.]
MEKTSNSVVARGWLAVGLLGIAAVAGACGGGGGTDAAVASDAGPIDCSGGDVAAGMTATTSRACAGCHGADLGGALMGTPGPNLTSDAISGWSDDALARSILDGIDDGGAPLCMSMTRYRLAGMTTTEACNIVAYLRSLAPITRDVADTCM